MNVYLNDLSLQSGKSILDNMPMIKKFNTLLEKLSSVSNITFCASHNLWDTPISGYNVKTGECTSGSIPYDYAMYLKVLYSKFSPTIGQLRYIFDSSLFYVNYPIAYLSIDLEGPELAFEVCNKKGKHQGECSWDGKMKKPKKNHDIKVKP